MYDNVSVHQSNAVFFFFSSRRRHTRLQDDWSSDVCSSDMFWLSQSLPLDEENEPGAEGPQEPQGGAGAIPATFQEGQPAASPPGMSQVRGAGTGRVPPAGTPGPQQPGIPNQTAPTPQPTGPVPGQA